METRAQQRNWGMLAQPPAQLANPAIAQQVPVKPIAPAPPIFALGPGRGDTLLDYSNTSHIKTYYKAVAPLETKYDGKPSSLCVFMNSVSNRAKNFGWHNILSISDANGATRNLINKYGQLTTEEVMSHAQNNWTNQPSRDAQNSEMMHHFLFESLGDSFKSTVLLKKTTT